MSNTPCIGLLIATIGALALGACVSHAQPCAPTRPGIQPLAAIRALGGLDGLAKQGMLVAIVQRPTAMYARGQLDLFVVDRKTRGALYWFQGSRAEPIGDPGGYPDSVLVWDTDPGQLVIEQAGKRLIVAIVCGEDPNGGANTIQSSDHCNTEVPDQDPQRPPSLLRVALVNANELLARVRR